MPAYSTEQIHLWKRKPEHTESTSVLLKQRNIAHFATGRSEPTLSLFYGNKKKLWNGLTGSSSIFPHPDDYRTSEQGWNIPAEKSRLLIGFNSLQNHWFYIPEIPEKSFIKLLKLKETISEAGLLTSYWQDTVYLSIYIIRIFL